MTAVWAAGRTATLGELADAAPRAGQNSGLWVEVTTEDGYELLPVGEVEATPGEVTLRVDWQPDPAWRACGEFVRSLAENGRGKAADLARELVEEYDL